MVISRFTLPGFSHNCSVVVFETFFKFHKLYACGLGEFKMMKIEVKDELITWV